MKLFIVETVGSSQKDFVVMAENESQVEDIMNKECCSYSKFYDKIHSIIPLSSKAIRVH